MRSDDRDDQVAGDEGVNVRVAGGATAAEFVEWLRERCAVDSVSGPLLNRGGSGYRWYLRGIRPRS